MNSVFWAAALGPASAGAVAVQAVEGAFRLSGATGPLSVSCALRSSDLGRAMAELARALDLADAGPPTAVVVDDAEPLRVVAITARQETYDTTIRPALAGLGCACSGGGLDGPDVQRPGGLELRVRQALAMQPDVLLIWEDGSPALQQWQTALALHVQEARRQPAWAIGAGPTSATSAAPLLLTVRIRASGDTPLQATLPTRSIAVGVEADLTAALWRELADVWRQRRCVPWPTDTPAAAAAR